MNEESLLSFFAKNGVSMMKKNHRHDDDDDDDDDMITRVTS